MFKAQNLEKKKSGLSFFQDLGLMELEAFVVIGFK